MSRLLYLGEYTTGSYITWCLFQSGHFSRIDHLTKPTLQIGHISMNPQPDGILIKCDWEDNDLEWAKRYAVEIPKIFVVCDMCVRKVLDYSRWGKVYRFEDAIHKHDLFMKSLTKLVLEELGEWDKLDGGFKLDNQFPPLF
jgi:hypothetical protein